MSQRSVSFSSWKPACSRRLRHSATTAGKARSGGALRRRRGGGAALTVVGRGAAVDEPHQFLRRRLHGLLRARRLRAPPPGSRREPPRTPGAAPRVPPIPPGPAGGARRHRTPPLRLRTAARPRRRLPRGTCMAAAAPPRAAPRAPCWRGGPTPPHGGRSRRNPARRSASPHPPHPPARQGLGGALRDGTGIWAWKLVFRLP